MGLNVDPGNPVVTITMCLRLVGFAVVKRADPDGQPVRAGFLISDWRTADAAKTTLDPVISDIPFRLVGQVSELGSSEAGVHTEQVTQPFLAHAAVAVSDIVRGLRRRVANRAAKATPGYQYCFFCHV